MKPYVYGAVVLDQILDVDRAERAEVFAGDPPLSPACLRDLLPVIADRPVDAEVVDPPPCCRACDAAIGPDGAVIDRLTGEAWNGEPLSFTLAHAPSIEAALRHLKLIALYPEVSIDPASLRLLRAFEAFGRARRIDSLGPDRLLPGPDPR